MMTLNISRKPPVLVIETTHSQERRSCGQLITGPYQLPCVFKKLGFKATVKASSGDAQGNRLILR